MRGTVLLCLTAAVAALAIAANVASADSADLQRSLDKPISLSVSDATMEDVFKKISDATGVKFTADPDVLALLPYGDQTRLAVTLRDITLRKALTPMLAPQALQWVVDGESIRIVPAEGLHRMCRRATYDELRVLGAIYSQTLQPAETASALDQLRRLTENKDIKLTFPIAADKDAAVKRADKVLPGTCAKWLDALCEGQDWTWYLLGDEVIIIDKARQVDRQLQRRVSLKHQGVRLVDVLHDLTRQARVRLDMEPGIIAMLPADIQGNFTLILNDVTISQALEVVSGGTGLKFSTTADGLKVEASSELIKRVEAAATQPRRGGFFVRMTMPGPDGADIEVMLTSQELPPDLVEAIQAKKAEFVKKLREALGKPEPATTSAPGQD